MTENGSHIVLVSGGSKGLGAALVAYFLSRGDRVACFSRSENQQVIEWREQYKDRFYYQPVDITDRQGVAQFVKEVEHTFGDVDILINNAGMEHTALLALTDDESMDRVIDLNLKGTLHLTRIVSRSMLSHSWGRIINVSSIVGLSGYRGLSIYSATKAAMDGFTRSLARELGARNITVNSIAPGYLTTEMTTELSARQRKQIISRTPLGRLGSPQDIAAVVGFLASPAADFVTGQVIVADGGISC
jgi:3-oxoacyl-[acyl-carrier protein] reductase